MAQIKGLPVRMGLWWNMVAMAAIITAIVAVFMLVYSFSLPEDKGLDGQGPISRGTWNVMRVSSHGAATPSIISTLSYQGVLTAPRGQSPRFPIMATARAVQATQVA